MSSWFWRTKSMKALIGPISQRDICSLLAQTRFGPKTIARLDDVILLKSFLSIIYEKVAELMSKQMARWSSCLAYLHEELDDVLEKLVILDWKFFAKNQLNVPRSLFFRPICT